MTVIYTSIFKKTIGELKFFKDSPNLNEISTDPSKSRGRRKSIEGIRHLKSVC